VRVCREFPRTATFKILTRSLAAERWHCADPVWVRERGDAEFVPLSPDTTHLLEPLTTTSGHR
jgi:fatty-acyl-CoA synthase